MALIIIILSTFLTLTLSILIINYFIAKQLGRRDIKKIEKSEVDSLYDNESIIDDDEINNIFDKYIDGIIETERSRTPPLE